jgi:ABC-type antimicrobial peptide transport system permease subunit
VVLALAGISAMTAFVVGRRSRELGVRIALGASKGRTPGVVMARAGTPIASGTVLGIGGGFAAAGLLHLVVVQPGAPVMATISLCAGVLLIAAAAAALQPSLRATRVDPKASLDK